MNFDPNEDRFFEWYHNGRHQFVVATWYEARQYHLNCYCENCGATYSRRGGRPGCCPECFSDATERLVDVWANLEDPWFNDEASPEDIEAARITNY